jgi:predicted ArsR family transcriptional regulator
MYLTPAPKVGDRLRTARLMNKHKGIKLRQQMLDYMRKHGTADTPALAAHLDMKVRNVRAQLHRLLEHGVIERCDTVSQKPIYRERKPSQGDVNPP